MTNLSLSAVFVGAALVCAALPFSLHWVPMKTPSVSLDQAHAQFVGQRPSVARNVAGVSRPVHRRTYRRAAVDRRRAAVDRRRAAGRRAAPYGYGGSEYGYVVEPGGYGRWCAVYPSGFRWCWTFLTIG